MSLWESCGSPHHHHPRSFHPAWHFCPAKDGGIQTVKPLRWFTLLKTDFFYSSLKIWSTISLIYDFTFRVSAWFLYRKSWIRTIFRWRWNVRPRPLCSSFVDERKTLRGSRDWLNRGHNISVRFLLLHSAQTAAWITNPESHVWLFSVRDKTNPTERPSGFWSFRPGFRNKSAWKTLSTIFGINFTCWSLQFLHFSLRKWSKMQLRVLV